MVTGKFWSSASKTFYTADKRYPDSPTHTGMVYSLETPYGIGDWDWSSAMQLSSYFKPKTTGTYIFKVSCAELCELFLSETDDDPSKKKSIVTVVNGKGRYQW